MAKPITEPLSALVVAFRLLWKWRVAILAVLVVLVLWAALSSIDRLKDRVLGFFGVGQQARIERLERENARLDQRIAEAEAESRASQAVTHIVVRTYEQAARTTAVEENNSREIQEVPGAGAPLDPALRRAVNDGLCRFQATPAAACAGLSAADTGEPESAGSGGSALG